MPVGLSPPSRLFPVAGIRLASTSAGIYSSERADVMLIALDESSTVSAVFTNNAFAAAPVFVARNHLRNKPRYFLVNAGNANAGTGETGINHALETCNKVAMTAGCRAEQVLPFSTGVIGEYLPVEKICSVIPDLYANLSEDNWMQCANAIMTTDSLPKGVSRKIDVDGITVTITGIAKGAGMIRPDMATMLAFVAIDANIQQDVLDKMVKNAVNKSFNRICIDGDTSTNDACVVMASAKSVMRMITDCESEQGQKVQNVLNEVCVSLAQSIIRDGEGATKFITVSVEKGRNSQECLAVAYTIATSPLVKTAFFASDPNWGRILAAVGRSGIRDLDIEHISIYLNNKAIVTKGSRDSRYTEEQGQKIMSGTDIHVRVVLNRGACSEKLWTSDLSVEYVRINAEYRS